MTDPVRSADDIVSRVARVTLGGQEYALRIRSIAANREWRRNLDERTTGLLDKLKDGTSPGQVYMLLAGRLDDLLDMLLAYDADGVLPTRDEIEAIDPDASLEVLAAVQEVWRASNPLVGTALLAMAAAEASSPATSSPRPPMGSEAPAISRMD